MQLFVQDIHQTILSSNLDIHLVPWGSSCSFRFCWFPSTPQKKLPVLHGLDQLLFVVVLITIQHPSCVSSVCPSCHSKIFDFLCYPVSNFHLYSLYLFLYIITSALLWIYNSTSSPLIFVRIVPSLFSFQWSTVSVPTWPFSCFLLQYYNFLCSLLSSSFPFVKIQKSPVSA